MNRGFGSSVLMDRSDEGRGISCVRDFKPKPKPKRDARVLSVRDGLLEGDGCDSDDGDALSESGCTGSSISDRSIVIVESPTFSSLAFGSICDFGSFTDGDSTGFRAGLSGGIKSDTDGMASSSDAASALFAVNKGSLGAWETGMDFGVVVLRVGMGGGIEGRPLPGVSDGF